ncbi:hypothetical protein QN277_026604 [Acacia crassicarpa]|uniref:Clp R domain-containing protein n=1 Tax=Acacia crassicarpa TaxID=499986 RepID=A0AAE1JBP8_9FABA|nr:hypothetical protein QN277_026604 [Acacia crassicarpa]
MRSGGSCGLPQTLTAEAASVLKHSLALARRRGHAQVTPLHVAATLLTLRSSSLRTACLKSHSLPPHHHTSSPLHCRALELCFNVALNRLPTSPPPSFLHPHQPSLSNALVAALKRAQAHHRRGCIEQQHQQPLLTPIKVELEQLIISILDDPSVSRVMREAGFSSAAVKNNLDESSASSVFQCYNSSGGVYSSPCSPEVPYTFDHRNIINPVLFSPLKRAPPPPVFSCNYYNEDVKLVLDILLRKKRKNTVIVGDSLSLTEGLVGELMGRFERGDVPDELNSTRFIKFQFPSSSSLNSTKREQVDMSLMELERKVDSVASLRGGGGGGVIVYIGDLKWTVGDSNLSEKEKGFSPVEHLVAEIGKLFCDYGNSSKAKLWLMGTASYQTYMRCQMRQPPLETLWALQAVPVPSSNGLGLSLHASSVLDSKPLFNDKEEQDKLTCCAECSSSYEKEAQMFKPGQKNLLPSWLQSHNSEAHHKDELAQLRRKWNRLCHCLHQSKHFQNQWGNTIYSNRSSNAKIYPCSSSYPWWPNQGSNSITTESSSVCFGDSSVKPSHSSSNLVPRFRRQQSCTMEFSLGNENQKHKATERSLDSLKGMEGKEVKITLALGNSSFGDSGQTVENITDHATLLRRAHICKLLQENVPWQSETLVSSIAEAFLVDSKSAKQNSTCWFYLQGNDSIGKRRLARTIAESLFGSAHFLFNLDMRKETSLSPCSEMLNRALKTHEQLVVLIENADFADAQFRKFFADGFETGKFGDFRAKENPGQRIIILTNNGSTKEQSQDDSVISLVMKVITETQPGSDHKRKAEWDLLTKFKRPRIEDKEEVVWVSEQKQDFSRQSSFNTLDLNIRAEEEEDDDDGVDKAGGSNPISSESQANLLLDSIENRFVFNKNPGEEDKRDIEALFSSKIKRYFEEVCGKQRLEKFSVEERVIEEMRVGCGSFTNSLFEKWLKDIFQSSLKGINMRGKEDEEGGILFKLCWGGKGDKILDSGFMSSCLPRNVQVSYSKD